jgi:hypothetical protein
LATLPNAGREQFSLVSAMFFEVAGTGLELLQDSAGNSTIAEQSGADSGALSAENRPLHPDLAAVGEAWPGLPAAIKAGILAMARAAGA